MTGQASNRDEVSEANAQLSFGFPPGQPIAKRDREQIKRGRTAAPRAGLSDAQLADLQNSVAALENWRGTASETIQQKTLILTEEVFETMKYLRSGSGIATTPRGDIELADELADLLFVSAAIANRIPTSLRSQNNNDSKGDSGYISLERCNANEQGDPSDLLTTALSLARKVLVIVTRLSPETRGSSATDTADVKILKSISTDVEEVVEIVRHIAEIARIDLSVAIKKKMDKDQLRLWE